ncbi:hypothetical protein TRAPUB_13395 [Trametes pubescens]|uniref:Uncharacterized protein n=1 Tax=Trametes pubescens TaxID=154538 RepID=A0A1M2VR93_TRAPU|nr:hypothetical protein TRAPUB_13395 [Trametes pubescens]
MGSIVSAETFGKSTITLYSISKVALNVLLDETDTKNKSYICFRQRDIKAVRKTRASQASYSDRMLRWKGELGITLDLVQLVHQRKQLKRESKSQNYYI